MQDVDTTEPKSSDGATEPCKSAVSDPDRNVDTVFPINATAGTQLQLDTQNSSTYKLWRFKPTDEFNDDNSFTVVNLETGWCVDANNGFDDLSPVTVNPCSGADSQIWSLKPVTGG
ncbi:hypothetical protein HDU76_007564, partial [Blyttiomyces sp. JEL0837]